MRIELEILSIGKKSFTTESVMFLLPNLQEAGRVKIVHAFVKKGEERSSEIPEDLLLFLNEHLVKKILP